MTPKLPGPQNLAVFGGGSYRGDEGKTGSLGWVLTRSIGGPYEKGMRTQTLEDTGTRLHTQERGLRRNRPRPHLRLRCPGPEKTLPLSHLVLGALLPRPQQTDTGSQVAPPEGGMHVSRGHTPGAASGTRAQASDLAVSSGCHTTPQGPGSLVLPTLCST